MSFVVAIVGRPNVGKSRLFNRLTRGSEAIVHDEAGVTRDRQYGNATYNGRPYTLIDTGGLVPDSDDDLVDRMHRQADVAIGEADAIIFLMDGRNGLMPGDHQIVERLRQAKTPVVFGVNKIDPGVDKHQVLPEFYELGEDLHAISAEHGLGVGDLLEEVMAARPEADDEDQDEQPEQRRVAVVGKPNVGKSTIVNALLGEDRVITSEMAGTTRDSIDTPFRRGDKDYLLIDTAGMRQKSNVDEQLEQLTVFKAIKSIERADIVLLMIEAPEGVTKQVKKISSVAENRGCACILLVNKWDLLERRPNTGDMYRDYLGRELPFLDWAPFLFTSALTGRRIDDVLDVVDRVYENHGRRITTSTLNDFIEEAVGRHSPPMDNHGRAVKFYYGTQVGVRPPTFVFFSNYPDAVPDAYKGYLENELREAFDFEGTPLRLYIRDRDG